MPVQQKLALFSYSELSEPLDKDMLPVLLLNHFKWAAGFLRHFLAQQVLALLAKEVIQLLHSRLQKLHRSLED